MIIETLLFVFGFCLCIYSIYISRLSGLRLLAHIKFEKKGLLYYLLMINVNNVIFFPSMLDEEGLALRARFIKGLRYGFGGGACLAISYLISIISGVGWK